MDGQETSTSWTPDDLRHLDRTREVEIAVPHVAGRPNGWTPIWVVVVDDEVFVRTWRRRDTGWYGRAVRSARTRMRVAGDSVDVVVAAIGDTNAAVVDAAYRTKYGRAGSESMVTAEAAASTLRLERAS
ncbi:DUF2255 family protein [Rathayibacter sp. KR2-224]|uniref:DUF2255 family protein n=1 Tax=Rathayibacter sp. KR2-224 TaxID=3400913 RepID=UPI003C05AE51